jgi:hypothetical protein
MLMSNIQGLRDCLGHSNLDEFSLSNYRSFTLKHIDFDWEIEWENRIISGTVDLTIQRLNDAEVLKLDSWGLDVNEIILEGESVKWNYGKTSHIGEGLIIDASRMWPEV